MVNVRKKNENKNHLRLKKSCMVLSGLSLNMIQIQKRRQVYPSEATGQSLCNRTWQLGACKLFTSQ